MNYKAIFFDYDGVLTTDKTGSLSTNKYLSKITGIDYNKIDSIIRPYNDDLLMGKISHLDIWDDICNKLNIKLNYKVLIDAFKSTPINNGMFLLAKKLNKKYDVGIITDNKKNRIDCLREHQKLDTIFSPIIVSAEIGCNKKNKAIFEKAISSLQLKPEDCIFIDNTNDNLVIPKEMGMVTIFHDDKINDIVRLENDLKENYNVY